MKRGVSSKTWISKAPGSRSRDRTRRMCRMFISTARLNSPALHAEFPLAPLDRAGGRVEEQQPDPAAGLGEPHQPAAGEVLHEQVEADADGVEAAGAAEDVLGGELAQQPHPVGVHGDHVRVPVADQVLHRVHGQPAGGRHVAGRAEDVQQLGRGPLGLVEDRLGQGAVAGDDVAGDLQLVQGEFDVAAVVEVRLEARPVLHHQLAQLRQGEEAEDVVVGRVEQVALAAADFAYGDRALHPLLAGRARPRRPPSRRRGRVRRWAAERRPRPRAAAVRRDSARCRPGRPAGRAYAPRARRRRPSPAPARWNPSSIGRARDTVPGGTSAEFPS